MTMDLPPTEPPSPTPPDPARVRAELDAALADAIRRSTTRAEFMRLQRIRALTIALGGTAA